MKGVVNNCNLNYLTTLQSFAASAAIIPTEPFEIYEKSINDIINATVARGNADFDATQQQTIESIAALCPLVGGLAVYKARSLLYLYNDSIYFDNVEICGLQGLQYKLQQTQKLKQKERINIYPNPTKNNITIEFDAKVESKHQIRLYNLLGQLIFTLNTSNSIAIIELSSYKISSGVYVLEIENSISGTLQRQKLVYEN